jgi:hypothetical protein
MVNEDSIVRDLGIFLQELRDYYNTCNHSNWTNIPQRLIDLRRTLLRKSGKYKKLITEITGVETVPIIIDHKEFMTDIWSVGLLTHVVIRTPLALNYCVNLVEQAIGILEDDIITGKRDAKTGEIIVTSSIYSEEPPKAFIAHGGSSGVLDKLRDFVQALGIDPLIVEILPTKGMSVDDKVNKYVRDADCGIVLATGGGIIDKKNEKEHPRLNVIDEFERLRTVFPDKTILLLEKGIALPSNISGLTYEPFVRQSMDRAFTAIARELTAFGILKAIKPKSKQ